MHLEIWFECARQSTAEVEGLAVYQRIVGLAQPAQGKARCQAAPVR